MFQHLLEAKSCWTLMAGDQVVQQQNLQITLRGERPEGNSCKASSHLERRSPLGVRSKNNFDQNVPRATSTTGMQGINPEIEFRKYPLAERSN